MTDVQNILFYCTAVILLALMPGPDIIFVITQGITKGKKEALFTSFGLGTGCIFHASLAAFGVAVIFEQSEIAFNVLKYFGAFYLFYLAYKTYKNAAKTDVSRTDGITEANKADKVLMEDKSALQGYRKGLLMNLLNPKVILFFLAFLPQFTPSNVRHAGLYMFVLGLIFMILSTSVFCLVSVLSSLLNKILISNSKLMVKVNKISAIILGILAILLLTASR